MEIQRPIVRARVSILALAQGDWWWRYSRHEGSDPITPTLPLFPVILPAPQAQSCTTFPPQALKSVAAMRLMALSHCSCPDCSDPAGAACSLTTCQLVPLPACASALSVRVCPFGRLAQTHFERVLLKFCFDPSAKFERSFWERAQRVTVLWFHSRATHQSGWMIAGGRSKLPLHINLCSLCWTLSASISKSGEASVGADPSV